MDCTMVTIEHPGSKACNGTGEINF